MDRYAGQRVLMIEVPGRRERVRPQNILRSSEGQPGGGRDRRGCWGK